MCQIRVVVPYYLEMIAPRHQSRRFGLLIATFLLSCYGSGTTSHTGSATGTGGTTGSGGGETSGMGGNDTGAAGSITPGSGGRQMGAAGASSPGFGGVAGDGSGGLAGAGSGAMAGAGSGGLAMTGTGGNTMTGTGGAVSTGAGGTNSTGSGGTGGTGTGGTDTPGWGTPVTGGPSGSGVAASITVNLASSVGTVGPYFVGFSYEKTHITNDSLNGTNSKLVGLYKLLGTPLVRIGANEVDLSNWVGTGNPPTQPSGQPFTHSITTGMVDELCSFLAAAGVKTIYGVNFHSGNVNASAAEAAYAMGKCGSSIYGFEIGNELDKYGSWASQQSQWESFATAVLATPNALLVGPATTSGASSSFAVPFAQSESAKFGNKLVLLTQHYYSGSAGSASATAANLQIIKSDILSISSTLGSAASSENIPNGYRFGECNTFSGHGQMGVSDTLIASLWALDLMFENAQHGSSGVNFHGGETGMDGTKPFYYEPIMEGQGAVIQVQPVYYAMLLFTQAGQGPVVSTAVASSNPNFTAYAIKANGFVSVVLDNKNASSAVSATVNIGATVRSASAIYLQGTPAGSLSAPAGSVTLAGATVSPTAVWNRTAPFVQATSGTTVSVYVPAASAALVRVPQ
jgi:hypothetical protein